MLARIGANMTAQVATLLLGVADRFVLVGILLRMWGPDLYADWAVLLASTALLGMAELGLGIYFGNSWQHAYADCDEVRFQRLVRISLYCYGLIAVVLAAAAIAFVGATETARLLSISNFSSIDTNAIFLLLAAAVILTIMRGAVSQIYRGRGEFARGTLVAAVPTALYLAIAIAAALLGASPIVLAGLYFLCNLAGTAFMALDIKRRYRGLVLSPGRPDASEFAEVVRYTGWNAVLLGSPIAWLQVPVLLLSAVGVSAGGLVSFILLRTLSNLVRTFTTFASISAAVEIAPFLHRGETRRLQTQLDGVGKVIAALVGSSCVAILLLGADFVELWTERRGLFDASILYWLVAASVAATVSMPFFTLFMLGNRPKPAAIAGLLQLAVGFMACAVLALYFGARGAAAGLAVGEIVASGLLVVVAAREQFAVDPWRYLVGCIVTLSLASAWAAAVLLVAMRAFGSQTVVQFVMCGIIFVLFGLLPVLFASLPQAQKLAVGRLLTDSAKRLTALASQS